MPFYAHSLKGADKSRWQPLAEHLQAVGALARQLATEARPGDAAFADGVYAAGLLHDLGKYRPEFQQMLAGGPKTASTRHKQAGAARAAEARWVDVAFAIAGHHGGLPDRADFSELVKSPGGQDVATAVWAVAVGDCPELAAHLAALPAARDPLVFDILTRLVFSCLVDADWSDTSRFYRRSASLPAERPAPVLNPDVLLKRVLDYIEGRAKDCRDARMAAIRDEILRAALAAAVLDPGLFSLTVPTGGGKTLASLAFALAHAERFGLRRVVYVAPYLSIIEQNAREIRRALGGEDDDDLVFEHHSLAEPPGGADDEPGASEVARRAEAWSSPVVVTTSVQFFESLFSNEPGRCRKLHNIARSVVILDECQTVPPGLVAPTCSMLGELARVVGSSFVLSTATQPAWSRRAELPEGLTNVREMVPPELRLFERLRRVRIVWPVANDEKWDWERVACEVAASQASLCIVNTKRAAAELFSALVRLGTGGAFHLSTAMCPAHRLQVLDEVRRRLRAGDQCRLVSTQLVEAGVDVDFPVVLREIGPLESMIQAAGRANREGLLNAPDDAPGGRVIVFRSVDGGLPSDRWYMAGTRIVDQDFLGAGRHPDVARPQDIAEYFRRLYHTGELDANGIEEHRAGQRFKSVADGYRVIDDVTTPVVIATWDESREAVAGLLTDLRRNANTRAFRRLMPYQVNLRRHELALHGHLSSLT